MRATTRRRWPLRRPALARPRADLPAAADLAARIDPEGRLAVRVTPNARREAIEITEDRVLVKVHAPPEDGKANAAVTELVARALGMATSRVEVLRGATSREKVLRISG